jgi:hypothetical protein
MSNFRAAILVGSLFLAAPATSHAFTFSAGLDFWDIGSNASMNGVSLGTGYGINIYPSWHIALGIMPELVFGAHMTPATQGTASTNLVYVPAMVGIRWDASKVLPLGPVAPFIGAHYGFGFVQAFGGSAGSIGGGSTNKAFSTVAGSLFHISDGLAVGAQAGYDVIQNDAGNVKIISTSGTLMF